MVEPLSKRARLATSSGLGTLSGISEDMDVITENSQGAGAQGPKGNDQSNDDNSTLPKKTCNLSTQKFIDILDTAAFVDKSLFIKAFLEDGNGVIVVLAPRRFCKSTNMDMLKEFLSGNKEIFEKNQLNIWKEERTFFDENCQKNPVIHVDFKSVGGKTEDEILKTMKKRLQNAYGDHQYLVKEVGDNYTWSDEKLKKVDFTVEIFIKYWKNPEILSRIDVIEGFKCLSQCLYYYYDKPVYVLIDEYDAPIMKAIMKTNPGQNILDEIIDLISEIMSSFLKGNDYVKRGLINASVRISEVLSYNANNIKYYDFLRDFVGYYGFTAKEVEDLFKRKEFVPFQNDDAVKHWYNGYRVMDTDTTIYSSYSILEYLDRSRKYGKQTFDRYWVGTGSIINMKALFAKCGIRELVKKLINGEEINITTVDKMTKENVQTLKALIHENCNVIDDEDAYLFINFLADNGYLNVINRNINAFMLTVRAPNEEIRTLLGKECYNAKLLKKKYNLQPKTIEDYTAAIRSVLQEPNENVFIRVANAVSDLFDKRIMPTNEDELHCILFTFLYNVKFCHARSELSVRRINETEKKKLGRPLNLDILVILGCVGMIIELKYKNESSEKAHEQIKTAGYCAVFGEPAYKNVTSKILVGLHMDVNKKVGITYTVDDTPKKSITSGERRVH